MHNFNLKNKFISVFVLVALTLALLLSGYRYGVQFPPVSNEAKAETAPSNEAMDSVNTEAAEQIQASQIEEAADFASAQVPEAEELEYTVFDPQNPFSYCNQPLCTANGETGELNYSLTFSDQIPKTDDDQLYLFEVATHEDELDLSDLEPIASEEKAQTVLFSIPFEQRHLFSRFVPAVKYWGSFVPISYGQYLSNPEALAVNTGAYPEFPSKKGILLDGTTLGSDLFFDLNVKRVVYNIPLSMILGETDDPDHPTIEYEYNGTIYRFNGYKIWVYDSLFSYLTAMGYHTTAIVLNDWNETFPEIIHPSSRQRTGRSLYYSFNTEEEDGVRLMEATALFLADRYSGGEHGMVYDWVIANEINQQRVWNYMATDDVEYYTDAFEKSFRTFYNAIKATYGNARVYFSLDHDWNNNGGNNYSFFNGRDILYTFNALAEKHGNYDWGLSIHPYPSPLTKTSFWNGTFDKTEEARVLTPMNLSSLTDVLTKSEFLDSNENVRPIAVTELGFSSRAGEQTQAAAFAYCYYIIEENDYINCFLLNRQTDDADSLKSGLALGIYNSDYSAKVLADVFKNIDTEAGADYIPKMLEIIGEETLEDALNRAK